MIFLKVFIDNVPPKGIINAKGCWERPIKIKTYPHRLTPTNQSFESFLPKQTLIQSNFIDRKTLFRTLKETSRTLKKQLDG